MSVLLGLLAGAAVGYLAVAFIEARRLGREHEALLARAAEAQRLAGSDRFREWGRDE
jgi:hypothetical protein